ncbi:alpha/beta hydrolase family esterase [Sphingomonas sp. FW199]|uniref:extracellular catalytic domain type 1 short-chain-length polyhydroxyalkanoate depolymerase n=1 Tax=Sphingomonas sp. FW199 TaxID=3400217 RepID=UPI003CEA1489
MPRLNDTVRRLSALRQELGHGVIDPACKDRLSDLGRFGTNPGALRGRVYVPQSIGKASALVVVLHGCTQSAAGYDHGAGWSRLADEHGFALLYPEQQPANNANRCFNWFQAGDTRRGAGEALSIRQMVAAMVARHPIDPARIFVTGLSAGGAMASVMLAAYPEIFAGGAIIAGLPYGTATSIPQAFDRMRAHGGPPATVLGQLVRDASEHTGPWPTISIWHGDSDAVVNHANAAMIVEQWRQIHGVEREPVSQVVNGHVRRAWLDVHGREVIEEYQIQGLGHGTPLSTAGVEACGKAGPFMLEAGISSTHRIAAFWGLLSSPAPEKTGATPASPASPRHHVGPRRSTALQEAPRASRPVSNGVGQAIEDALRAAGLIR